MLVRIISQQKEHSQKREHSFLHTFFHCFRRPFLGHDVPTRPASSSAGV